MPRCGSCRGGGDPAPPCWATFREEWSPCEDFYYVRDPVTDRILDIPETFAPLGLLAIMGKLVTALATMGTLAYAIYKQDDNEDRAFMFAYLTFWVLPLQCLYHIMSLSNSLLPSSIWILAAIDQPEDYVEGRCRRTWYLFNLSLAASIIVAGYVKCLFMKELWPLRYPLALWLSFRRSIVIILFTYSFSFCWLATDFGGEPCLIQMNISLNTNLSGHTVSHFSCNSWMDFSLTEYRFDSTTGGLDYFPFPLRMHYGPFYTGLSLMTLATQLFQTMICRPMMMCSMMILTGTTILRKL